MKTKLTQYLKDLVAIDSASGNEQAICDYIESKLVLFKPIRVDNSLACKLPGKKSGHCFILNGHIDTVESGKIEEWKTDPYKLIINNDKASGLGTSDMKAGVAIMLALAESSLDKALPCDIWLFFSESEEVDGSGTKKLLSQVGKNLKAYTQYGGLILEPTSATQVETGHKGNVFVDVIATGLGGHASQYFDNDQTALMKLTKFLAKIPTVQAELRERFTDKQLGSPTINVTHLSAGGDSYNVIPSSAKAVLDIRITPQLDKSLGHLLSTLGDKYKLELKIIADTHNSCGYCEPTSMLYACAKDFFKAKEFTISEGATDQCFFSELQIPMLIYGPGEPSVMHSANEYVMLSKIEQVHDEVVDFIGLFAESSL